MLTAMRARVASRSGWDGQAVAVGDVFRVHTDRCGRQLEAACRLVTHPLGWELRLEIAGSLQRSQVCRSHDETLDISEQWKAAMIEGGWS